MDFRRLERTTPTICWESMVRSRTIQGIVCAVENTDPKYDKHWERSTKLLNKNEALRALEDQYGIACSITELFQEYINRGFPSLTRVRTWNEWDWLAAEICCYWEDKDSPNYEEFFNDYRDNLIEYLRKENFIRD